MRCVPLSLIALVAVSGCAGTRWSVTGAHPLIAVAVPPAEVGGFVDAHLVAERRSVMIGELRARGYQVLGTAPAGVPTLRLKIEGRLVDDSLLHAPDDPRHNIYNDLHYRFVAYSVHLDVVDGGGRILACGHASSNGDPEAAVAELTARLVRDLPAAPSAYAAR